MDMKDKLYKLTGADKKETKDRSKARTSSSQIEGVDEFSEQGVEHYVKREKYGPHYQHGKYQLGQISSVLFSEASFLLDCEEGVSREEVLFMDTETTGLAGGTGTCAFIVGIGYFSDEDLILEQHLMRDFEEEHSLLSTIKQRIQARPIPVTFNGKTFDIPLLKNRFILQRLDFPDMQAHFDLLHPCRRMWNHFSSCSLNSLEKNLLEFNRKKDIEGSEVPHYFRAYLENKNWKLLQPIFRHNCLDIISLAVISLYLNKVALLEGEYDHSAREYFNLGRQLEKADRRRKSITAYERALNLAENRSLKRKIEKKLTWQYKREDAYKKAVEIWELMLEENRGGLFPYIELAKYYEHQQKNYESALKICKLAREFLQKKRVIISDWRQKREELEHRMERLRRKQ